MKFVLRSVLLNSFLWASSVSLHLAAPVAEKGPLAMQSLPAAKFKFTGVLGERITSNIDGWLLSAPRTNPGMLEMFRVRDRQPVPQLVPWAGEFAGKYLLSGVAALRQTERVDLRQHLMQFVAELITTQASDGYLGPFPEARRLLGEWDLWGHYHVMQGLLEWHAYSGDESSLTAVRKAADLICRTYLDGTRHVIDAGSEEMNMAISHVMAALYRRTGEKRYFTLVQQIEKDWEKAGDYLRTGVNGVPFYKTPRPRWESLHDLQTLVELWRITGEAKYRDAFISHWRTILANDVRNTGAFSGGEQATGNPWAPTPIETCCTVAWMALGVDMLRLTGAPEVAEELERASWNGALGAQHPCGRWWTYNTPMDGDRKSSAHDIVFQARAGTPELNCCSVNGPRTLGMLADWAVMRQGDAIVINTHAPFSLTTGEIQLTCESNYPLSGDIVWHITTPGTQRIRFRIPTWAEGATASLLGKPLEVKPGTYCEIERNWKAMDTLEFHFPLTLRSVPGQREQAGRISVYRGPLLLAWDQRDNAHDEFAIPKLTEETLQSATTLPAPMAHLSDCPPWLLLEMKVGARSIRLRDFATAGMNGTRYRSWLPLASGNGGKAGGPPALTAAKEPVELNGKDELLSVPLPDKCFQGDFSVSFQVKVHSFPEKRLGQLFSAWCAPGDDPLRITIDGGLLYARIEAAQNASTGGATISKDTWCHVAAVKEGNTLTLFLNGQAVAAINAPATSATKTETMALGGNPKYTAVSEHLAATFRDFALWSRALSEDEVSILALDH